MIDPVGFKEFEHKGWQSVADSYHDYFAQLTTQAIAPLIELLELEPGMSVLDVATGPGYVAAQLADAGGKVTALDFSSVMVERAQKLYSGIQFIEGDAENLPFEDGRFDTVTMNFGILHFPHPQTAVTEAYRVLRSRGRFAFTVWSPPDEALGFKIILDAVQSAGDPKVALPAGPPFFQFSLPDQSYSLLEQAGFVEIITRKVPMCWVLPSTEDFFTAFYMGTPRTGGLLRAQTPAHLSSIQEQVETSLMPYQVNGQLEIPMACLVSCGNKP